MLSTGIDIVANSRFSNPSERLLGHLFTNYELEKGVQKSEYYASRFAAKEAFVKALGTGFSPQVTPKDIEIRCDDLGKPYFVLYNGAKERIKGREISLSISHEKEYSVAMVVIL